MSQAMHTQPVRLLALLLCSLTISLADPLYLEASPGKKVEGTMTVPRSPVRILLGGTFNTNQVPAKGDKVYVISSATSCTSASTIISASALANATLGDLRSAEMDLTKLEPSVNQLCICPASSTTGACFQGGNFQIQEQLIGIQLDDVIGSNLTVPQQICTASDCSKMIKPNIFTYNRASKPLGDIAVVLPDKLCSGITSTTSSSSQAILFAGINHLYPSQPLNALNSGMYKVCFNTFSGSPVWYESGIFMNLQSNIAHLQANGIPAVSVYAPQAIYQQIRVCTNWNCTTSLGVGDQVSFIPVSTTCDSSTNPASPSQGFSGYLSAADTGFLGPQSVIDNSLKSGGFLPPATYQLCFKRAGSSVFVSTGTYLVVQNLIFGLEVNGLSPLKGLKLTIPKSSKITLRYMSVNDGSAGDSVALIEVWKRCSDLCQTRKIKECDPTAPDQFAASNFLSAHGNDKVLGSTTCLGSFEGSCSPSPERRLVNLSFTPRGSYQVCFRPAASCSYFECWPLWSPTGIAVEIQDAVTSLEANGVIGGTINAGDGQRLRLPLYNFHSIAYYGTSSKILVGLVGQNEDCTKANINTQLMFSNPGQPANITETRRMFGAGSSIVPGTYALCYTTAEQLAAGFMNSGISVTLQNAIAGLQVNGIRPNAGVITAMPSDANVVLTFFGARAPVVGDEISLLPPQLDCENPAHVPASFDSVTSGRLGLVVLPSAAGPDSLTFAPLSFLPQLPEGKYKVCFRANGTSETSVDTGFRTCGLLTSPQSALMSLFVNTPPSYSPSQDGRNPGLRTVVAKNVGNTLRLSSGGTVSFIPHQLNCMDPNDNPPLGRDAQFLHINTQSPNWNLDVKLVDNIFGPVGALSVGLYQVCFKPSGSSTFLTTGIAVQAQEEVIQLTVNDCSPNNGLRVAMPKSSQNILRMLSGNQLVGSTDDKISLILLSGDCSLQQDNPPALRSSSSGHIKAVDSLFTFVDLAGVQVMSTGFYQVCFLAHAAASFVSTGIVIEIQQDIFSLVVNEVSALSSSAPKERGNLLGYCLDLSCSSPGQVGDAVSFIGSWFSCEDEVALQALVPLVATTTSRAFPNDPSSSSSVVVDTFLGSEGLLDYEVYQTCFRKAGSTSWRSTGLSLRVHDDILGIAINDVMPNNGLRASAPRSQGGKLSYYRSRLGEVGETLSLIPAALSCSNPKQNPAAGDANSTGYLTFQDASKTTVLGSELSAMQPGLYQVCYKGAGQNFFSSTGISCRLQQAITSIKVNSQPQGQTALLPKTDGIAMKFEGNAQLQGAKKASLVMSRADCTDTVNANNAFPGPTRSGHSMFLLAPGFNSFIAMDTSILKSSLYLVPLTYHLCLYLGPPSSGLPDQGWIATGISMAVKNVCPASGESQSFGYLAAFESSSVPSQSNIINLLFRFSSLPPSGTITISGLTGSQTVDSGSMTVYGNTVIDERHELACLSNTSCSATLTDFLANGQQIIDVLLRVDVACSDFDSCGEGLDSISVNGNSMTQLLTRGPFASCSNSCSNFVTMLQETSVSSFTGRLGQPIRVQASVSPQVNAGTCGGFFLNAKILIKVRKSILSTHSITGAWSQLSGELTIPSLPYDSGVWQHISFSLINPSSTQPAKYPSVSFCSSSSSSSSNSVFIPATVVSSAFGGEGLLSASLPLDWMQVELKASNDRLSTGFRYTLQLLSNIPVTFPAYVAITVTGITNTLTGDDSRFGLLLGDYRLTNEVECQGTDVCSAVVNVSKLMDSVSALALHRTVLDVSVFCIDFGAPKKSISAINICQWTADGRRCPAGTSISSSRYSTGPWQGCGLCSLEKRAVLRNFDLQDLVGMYGNVLQVELVPSPDVSKLGCSFGEMAIRAVVSLSGELAQGVGSWNWRLGQLKFRPPQGIAVCSTPSTDPVCLPRILVEFDLKNPTTGSNVLYPSIIARGGNFAFQGYTSGKGIDVLEQATLYFYASARESNPVLGNSQIGDGNNILSLSFQTNISIPAGTLVTLSGLVDMATPSALCAPQAAPACDAGASCIFDTLSSVCQRGIRMSGPDLPPSFSGSWDRDAGTLVFAVLPSFQQVYGLDLSFSLRNSITRRNSPPQLYLEASHPSGSFKVFKSKVKANVTLGDIFYANSTSSPSFLVLSGRESQKVEHEMNEIAVDLVANVRLGAGSWVEISGLRDVKRPDPSGPQTPSSGEVLLPNINIVGQGVSAEGYFWKASDEMQWICEQSNRTDVVRFGSVVAQQWCRKPDADSVYVSLSRCFDAGERISFSFQVQNLNVISLPPQPLFASAFGDGVSLAKQLVPPAPVASILTTSCTGQSSCTTSILQDPACHRKECRFLPPAARLDVAVVNIDILCTDLEEVGKYVERIGVCRADDCTKYGSGYVWDQTLNRCCDSKGLCKDYLCSNTLTSWIPGPFAGCSSNCTSRRTVLQRQDILPVICDGGGPCLNPSSFVLVVSLSALVQQPHCSPYLLDAQVSFELQYSYDSVAYATQIARIQLLDLQESTNVSQSENLFRGTLQLSGRVSKGSELRISGLLGSQTASARNISIESLQCSEDERGRVTCQDGSSSFFQPTGEWDKPSGTLKMIFSADVAAMTILGFRFRILNGAASQAAVFPVATVKTPSAEDSVTCKVGVLSSAASPKLQEFLLSQSNQITEGLVRVEVMFRCNFEVSYGTVISLGGLLNSRTADTDSLTVNMTTETVSARWLKSTGTLTFTVSRPVQSGSQSLLSFLLLRPGMRVDPAQVTLAVVTAGARITLSQSLGRFALGNNEEPSFRDLIAWDETTVAGQVNEISIAFSPNFNMPRGLEIIVSGVTRSSDDASLTFPVKLQGTASATSTTAIWHKDNLSFSLAFPETVSASQRVVLSFQLHNLPAASPAKSVFVAANHKTAIHVSWLEASGQVQKVDQIASISLASLAESSQIANKNSTIVLLFKSNLRLRALTGSLEVAGLVGSPTDQTLVETCVSISDSWRADGTCARVENSAQWQKTSGSLRVSFQQDIEADSFLLVSFTLVNPPQSSPKNLQVAVYQAVTNSFTKVKDLAIVSPAGTALSSSPSGSVSSFSMQQTSLTQGGINNLTLQFQLKFPIGQNFRMTIMGLLGTSVRADGEVELEGPDALLFGQRAVWDSTSASLLLDVAPSAFQRQDQLVQLSFLFRNPYFPTPGGVNPRLTCSHLAQPFVCRSCNILNASVAPVWQETLISESSPVKGARNSLTVSIKSSVQLPASTDIMVRGLPSSVLGSLTKSGLNASLIGSISVDGQSVVHVVTNGPIAQSVPFEFDLQVVNPSLTSAPANLTVTAVYMSASKVFSMPQVGLQGAVMTGSQDPAFLIADVSESLEIDGAINRIDVRLVANVGLGIADRITISNLDVKFPTSPDQTSVDIASSVLQAAGSYSKQDKSLVLTPKVDLYARQDMNFSFLVYNPKNLSSPVELLVSTPSIPNSVLKDPRAVWNEGILKWKGAQDPTLARSAVLNAGEAYSWSVLELSESSSVPGQANTLSFHIRPNVDVEAGSIMTISGLKGTSTPDSTSLVIYGLSSVVGTWTQATGTVSFRIPVPLSRASTLLFQIQIRNGLVSQLPLRPQISLSAYTTLNEKFTIPFTSTSTSDSCCLTFSGVPLFLNASVYETTAVVGEENILEFLFKTNIDIPPTSLLVISGLGQLRSLQNPNVLPPTYPSGLVQWDSNNNLRVQMSEAFFDPCCSSSLLVCHQDLLTLRLQVRNPSVVSQPTALRVSLLDGQGASVISGCDVAGASNVLRGSQPPSLIGTFSETDLPASGPTTNVTTNVSLLTSVGLSRCNSTVRSGQASWIVGNSPPEGKQYLFDGLKGTVDGTKVARGLYIELDMGENYLLEQITVYIRQVDVCAVKDAELYYLDQSSGLWRKGLTFHISPSLSSNVSSFASPPIVARQFRLLPILPQDNFASCTYSMLQELEFYSCPQSQCSKLMISNVTNPPATGSIVKLLDYPPYLMSYGYWDVSTRSISIYAIAGSPAYRKISISADFLKTGVLSRNYFSASLTDPNGFQNIAETSLRFVNLTIQSEGASSAATSSLPLAFSEALIGQTSSMAEARNLISVTLTSAVDLVQGQRITVKGLDGATSNSQAYTSVAPTGILSPTYEWQNTCPNQQTLCGLVIFTLSASWAKGQTLTATMEFVNKKVLGSRTSPLTLSVSSALATQPVCKEMNTNSPGVCLQEAEVLNVDHYAGVVNSSILQGSAVVGQRNMISVHVVPNFEVTAGCLLNLTGLVNVDVLYSDIIYDNSNSNLQAYAWSKEFGFLTFRAVNALNSKASPSFSFSFSVTNFQSPASSVFNVSISGVYTDTAGSCGKRICDILGGAGSHVFMPFTAPVFFTEASAHLLQALESPGFSVLVASESSNVSLQDNLISIQLVPNIMIFPDTKITLLDLTSPTAANPNLPMLASNQSISGVWDGSGSLTFSLSAPLYAYKSDLLLKFILRNPATAQLPKDVRVLFAGSSTQKLAGSILRAADTARIISLTVEESSTVTLADNTLSFKLRANVPLVQGTMVNVSHLTGRYESADFIKQCQQSTTLPNAGLVTYVSTRQLMITVDNIDVVATRDQTTLMRNFSECLVKDSSISFLLPKSFQASETVQFSFRVINWIALRAQPDIPQVSMAGCSALLSLTGQISCDATTRIDLPGAAANNAVLRSGGTPLILEGRIEESSSLLGELNLLTASLRFNFELIVGSSLVLGNFSSGLAAPFGSSTPSGTISLEGPDAVWFDSKGSWRQVESTLTLVVTSPVPANTSLSLRFSLRNMASPPPSRCQLGSAYCASGVNEGQYCTRVGAQCAGTCGQGQDICVAQICTPPNTGHQCPVSSLLSANGINGPPALPEYPYGYATDAYDSGKGTVEVKGEVCTGNGQCLGYGTCSAPNTGSLCTTHSMCTGMYYPSVDPSRPLFERIGTQRCVRMQVDNSLSFSLNFNNRFNLSQTMIGNLKGFSNPSSPEFVTRTIIETSTIPNAYNILTLSLVSNFKILDINSVTLTLKGLTIADHSGKLPVMQGEQGLLNEVGCANLGSNITCLSVGGALSTSDKILLEAKADLEIHCTSSSNPVLTTVKAACYDITSSVLNFPCSQFPDCPDGWCKVFANLDVIPLLSSSSSCSSQSSGGFDVYVASTDNTLPARVMVRANFSREYATWDSGNRSLVIKGSQSPSGYLNQNTLKYSFRVRNPPPSSSSPTLTITGETADLKAIGICADQLQPGCVVANEPNPLRSIVTGQVLKSNGRAALDSLTISESSEFKGLANTISVSLSSSTYKLVADMTLTLMGLTGSLTTSSTIPISGNRLSRSAQWDAASGNLKLSVTYLPASESDPLIFSFVLKNPSDSQPKLVPSLAAAQAGTGIDFAAQSFVCVSTLSCQGILGASTDLTITSWNVAAQNFLSGSTNSLQLFVESNVKLTSPVVSLTLSGISQASLLFHEASASVRLFSCDRTIQRSYKCSGRDVCATFLTLNPPNGTFLTDARMTLAFSCALAAGIKSIRVCNQQVPYEPQVCSGDRVVNVTGFTSNCGASPVAKLQVDAPGWETNVTITLMLTYAFDTLSPKLVFSPSSNALVLTMSPRPAEFWKHSALSYLNVRYENMIAICFHATNPTENVPPVFPALSASLGSISFAPPKGIVNSILGGQVLPCSSVQTITSTGSYPSNGYWTYNYDNIYLNKTFCNFIIQPPKSPDMLIRVTFTGFDISMKTDAIRVYDGDSTDALLVGAVVPNDFEYLYTGPGQPFSARNSLYSQNCNLLIRLERYTSDGMQFRESLGRGFQLQVDVVNPALMDHVITTIQYQGGLLTDLQLQKIRSSVSISLGLMLSYVIVEATTQFSRSLVEKEKEKLAARKREPLHGIQTNAQARAYQTITFRILATSNSNALLLLSELTKTITSGTLTQQIRSAGLTGSVSLLSSAVYRCGIEIICVVVNEVVTTTAAVVEIVNMTTPVPFPVQKVIKVVAFVVIPLCSACVLICCGMVIAAYRTFSRKSRAKKESMRQYVVWLKEYKCGLHGVDGNLKQLCGECDFNSRFLEADWDLYIDEFCAKYFMKFEASKRNWASLPKGFPMQYAQMEKDKLEGSEKKQKSSMLQIAI